MNDILIQLQALYAGLLDRLRAVDLNGLISRFTTFRAEDLNFTLPVFQTEMYFTQDVVMFLLTILAILTGLLLCFQGYRYFFTLILLAGGCLSGAAGIFLLEDRIGNPVLKLFLFVSFVFLGECVLFAVSSILSAIIKKPGLRSAVRFMVSILAPALGAALVFAVVYFRIYHDPMIDLTIAGVLFLLGLIHQKRAKRLGRDFHTYDELYAMERTDGAQEKYIDIREEYGGAPAEKGAEKNETALSAAKEKVVEEPSAPESGAKAEPSACGAKQGESGEKCLT